jgi:hypothetical protein
MFPDASIASPQKVSRAPPRPGRRSACLPFRGDGAEFPPRAPQCVPRCGLARRGRRVGGGPWARFCGDDELRGPARICAAAAGFGAQSADRNTTMPAAWAASQVRVAVAVVVAVAVSVDMEPTAVVLALASER